MKKDELRGRIVAKGMNIDSFCRKIGMKRVTFDRRMRGDTEFTRDEIEAIAEALDLLPADMCDIFFTNLVA